MILKCPTCRRRYTLESRICGRCNTDLTGLVSLALKQQQLIERGFQLIKLDPALARESFLAADKIMSENSEVQRGLALAALIQGDFQDVLNYYNASLSSEFTQR